MITTEVESLDAPTDPALAAAVDLLAASVPASCAGLVPYHAAGYPSYLAAALAPPAAARTVILRCLRSGDRIDAVADWRLLADGLLLLNGISVHPDEQGRGHGSRLLRDGVSLAHRSGCDTLALDVSADNTAARRLYDRLGFVERSRSVWVGVPTTGTAPDKAVRLTDWPAFAAHRDSYGFGDLRLDTPTGAVTARVVGSALRVPPGPGGRNVPAALTGLVTVDRCWTIQPDSGADDGFARFTRMHRPVRTG